MTVMAIAFPSRLTSIAVIVRSVELTSGTDDGERGEVVMAEQRLRGVAHHGGVERLRDMRVRLVARRRPQFRRSRCDTRSSSISRRSGSGNRRRPSRLPSTRMSCGSRLLMPCAESARLDRERHVGVRALRRARERRRRCVRRLRCGSDVAEHLRQRRFDDVLNRRRIRLRLPAGVARAEVLKRQENAHDSRYFAVSICVMKASVSFQPRRSSSYVSVAATRAGFVRAFGLPPLIDLSRSSMSSLAIEEYLAREQHRHVVLAFVVLERP